MENSLHLAAKHNDLETFKKIYNSRIYICNYENDYPPLHIAVKYGNINIVKEILSSNKDFLIDEIEFNNHQTPLHIAIINKHVDIVKELLKPSSGIKGAMYVRDMFGRTPLKLASAHYYENGELMSNQNISKEQYEIQEILKNHYHVILEDECKEDEYYCNLFMNVIDFFRRLVK